MSKRLFCLNGKKKNLKQLTDMSKNLVEELDKKKLSAHRQSDVVIRYVIYNILY